MPVETPLEALATPELDGKRLVAFCKAMELTDPHPPRRRDLRRRRGLDRAGPALRRPGGWPGGQGVALLEREGDAPAEGALLRCAERLLPRRASPRPRRRAQRPPISPPRARRRRARRSTARPTRSCGPRPNSAPGSPAREDEGVVAIDAETSLARPAARRAHRPVAGGQAGRGLLHPDRPPDRRGRSVRRRAASRPTRSPKRRRSRS